MSDVTPNERPNSASKPAFFASVLNRLSRATPQKGQAAQVATLPVAQLASRVLPSPNGGPYQRANERLIVGADWICASIETAAQAIVEPPPCGIAVIEDATVCGEGIVCKKTPQGIFAAAESLALAATPRSILPLRRSADGSLSVDGRFGRNRLPEGPTYAFLRQVSDNNYGHWLIESLPKIGILADHFDLARLTFIITRHRVTRKAYPMRKIYYDTLAGFGIAPEQIVESDREAISVPRLLYPLPMTQHPWVKAPRAIAILEALRDRLAPAAHGPRRLYVSRAHAPKRHLVNEAEIVAILKDHDVTVVYPERLSFVEQVRLFANAELVMGNYGANLTNAVFAPRGVTLFAITAPGMSDDFFWDLANLKGGRYFSLHGEPAGADAGMNANFRIDPAQFLQILEERVLR